MATNIEEWTNDKGAHEAYPAHNDSLFIVRPYPLLPKKRTSDSSLLNVRNSPPRDLRPDLRLAIREGVSIRVATADNRLQTRSAPVDAVVTRNDPQLRVRGAEYPQARERGVGKPPVRCLSGSNARIQSFVEV